MFEITPVGLPMALVGGLYLFLVSGRLFGRDDDAREVKHGVPTIAAPLIESGQVGDAQLFAERRPLAPLKAIIALATFAAPTRGRTRVGVGQRVSVGGSTGGPRFIK